MKAAFNILVLITSACGTNSQEHLPAVNDDEFLTGDGVDFCLATAEFSRWMPFADNDARDALYNSHAVNGTLVAIDAKNDSALLCRYFSPCCVSV